MKWYTVWDNRTDDVLACGTSKDCRQMMGLSESAFKSLAHNVKTGKNNKFSILVEPFNGFDE